jgi:capsular exopolysaccharide synthesis family protein
MSRIEDALRRSGASRSKTSGAGIDPATAFASAWDFGDGEAVTAEAEPLSPVPSGPSSRLVTSDIPTVFREEWKALLVSPEGDRFLVEQFRKLAASLLHGQRDGRLKTLMVTSAVPGEGKTLTALNLALVLTEVYRRRVLLIDADLRRPRISEAANLRVADGLAEALKSPGERKVSVVQLSDLLTLLPAGRPDPEPLSGLTSPRMQKLLEEASEQFEWVIIDTPPVEAAADASLLAAIVDAIILVVRAEHTAHGAVQSAIESLGRDRIFGVVLNGVSADSVESYGEYPAYTAASAAD